MKKTYDMIQTLHHTFLTALSVFIGIMIGIIAAGYILSLKPIKEDDVSIYIKEILNEELIKEVPHSIQTGFYYETSSGWYFGFSLNLIPSEYGLLFNNECE